MFSMPLVIMVMLFSQLLEFCFKHVATLTLGSRPKQGLVRVRAKKEARESHLMLLGVQKSVKE
jgi:hypothetical protein